MKRALRYYSNAYLEKNFAPEVIVLSSVYIEPHITRFSGSIWSINFCADYFELIARI